MSIGLSALSASSAISRRVTSAATASVMPAEDQQRARAEGLLLEVGIARLGGGGRAGVVFGFHSPNMAVVGKAPAGWTVRTVLPANKPTLSLTSPVVASLRRCSTNAISRNSRPCAAELVRLRRHGCSAARHRPRTVQDTYLRALEAGEHAGIDTAQAWLTTVMQHLAIDRLRREGWMRRWLDEAGSTPEPAKSAETEAARAEETGQAVRLLAERLSPADGAAVLLREVFEVSFKELAEATGRTEAAPGASRCTARCCGCASPARRRPTAPGATPSSRSTSRRCAMPMRGCCSRCCASRRHGRSGCRPMPRRPRPRPRARRARACRVVQIGGRLGLVLTLGREAVVRAAAGGAAGRGGSARSESAFAPSPSGGRPGWGHAAVARPEPYRPPGAPPSPSRGGGEEHLRPAAPPPAAAPGRSAAPVPVVRDHHEGRAVAARELSSISSNTVSAVLRSRLPVGSSASTQAGCVTSARAIATRWRSPPDSSAGPVVQPLAPGPRCRQHLRAGLRGRAAGRRGRILQRHRHVVERRTRAAGGGTGSTKPRLQVAQPALLGRVGMRDVLAEQSDTEPAVGASSPPIGCAAACSCPSPRRRRWPASRRRATSSVDAGQHRRCVAGPFVGNAWSGPRPSRPGR